MADKPFVVDITKLVVAPAGTGSPEQAHEAAAKLAAELVRLIYRTVQPADWLKMGGLGTVGSCFKPDVPGKSRWKLIVHSDSVTKDTIDKFITALLADS